MVGNRTAGIGSSFKGFDLRFFHMNIIYYLSRFVADGRIC